MSLEIEFSNCWNKMPETEEVWGQCIKEMREALKTIHELFELQRNKKLLNIENIKALDPGKVYVVEICPEDASEDIIKSISETCKVHKINIIMLVKGICGVVSVPEGMEVVKKRNIEDRKDVMEAAIQGKEMIQICGNTYRLIEEEKNNH